MNFNPFRFSVALLLLLNSGLNSGCEWLSPMEGRPFPKQNPYVRTYTKPGVQQPRRVAVLPVECDQAVGEALKDMDEIFLSEVGKKLRFELIPISRPDLSRSIHREQFSSTEPTPPEALGFFREKYAVDAVLFTEITSYRPYRPMSIGARSKLVDISTLSTLWSAETVLDSGDPIVASAAARHARRQSDTSDTRGEEMVLQSPRRYSGFVASYLYSSIPKYWLEPVAVTQPFTPPQGAPQNPPARTVPLTRKPTANSNGGGK
jgi:hypothetical protein